MSSTFNCLIMGAAGRDFHDLQTFFRDNTQFRVCAFTASQIPYIAQRRVPRSLAGPGYETDIPIFPEDELASLIERFAIDFVFLAYSDLSHVDVMHKASLVQACGAGFALLGPKQFQLQSHKPVISVTAVRTGAGKSPLTRWIADQLRSGHRVAIIRHPMPYGDLEQQRVQRFATAEDLDRAECTIEEREEYEPFLERGLTVFAGVDYEAILRQAETEADVILWDGGNNDLPFVRAGLSLVVADALRPGHELAYFPGETNLRMADIVVINKVAEARAEDVWSIRDHIAQVNADAEIVESNLEMSVDQPEAITGRTVLVVEDGPTLTHGGMSYGAGLLAARRYEAGRIIDPRSVAVGSIAEAYRDYPHLGPVLPALGYSPQQRAELCETINSSGADVVIDASPARLDRVLTLAIQTIRVRYEFLQVAGPSLETTIQRYLIHGRPSG
jgi:predicted GTPase